jgi:hypothetical protein
MLCNDGVDVCPAAVQVRTDGFKQWVARCKLGTVLLKDKPAKYDGLDNKYQSFSNTHACGVSMLPGSTHVSVGFADLAGAARCAAVRIPQQLAEACHQDRSVHWRPQEERGQAGGGSLHVHRCVLPVSVGSDLFNSAALLACSTTSCSTTVSATTPCTQHAWQYRDELLLLLLLLLLCWP